MFAQSIFFGEVVIRGRQHSSECIAECTCYGTVGELSAAEDGAGTAGNRGGGCAGNCLRRALTGRFGEL
ncbi:MAG: hypothetical protein CMI61_02945, partial [Parvibaculum sp.]|nr:hypothetical protein [Parvibaculum sp.]